MIATWYETTIDSLLEIWEGFLVFTPKLVGAVVVVIIGWIVAVAIGKLVVEILRRIKFDKLFERGVWKEALSKAKWNIDPSGFIGGIVKWVLFIAVLIPALEILELDQFAYFMGRIAAWLPNLIAAAAIFVVAVIISDYLPKIIRAGAEGMKISYGNFLEKIVRWSIWLFAFLAILIQLQVMEELLMTLFTGFIAFLVIAGGLAFGLGGKDAASDVLEDFRKKIKD